MKGYANTASVNEAADREAADREAADRRATSGVDLSTKGESDKTGPSRDDLKEPSAAMAKVEQVVGEHFPEALDSVKAAIAVIAVGAVSDNAQPTSLILSPDPGQARPWRSTS